MILKVGCVRFLGFTVSRFFHRAERGGGGTLKIKIFALREAKFKRVLKLHFLTQFTKNLLPLTPKVKSDTDMINPSIKSSDFLFWHEKIWSRIFENFVGNRQSTFHILKFRV
jgi:uncharacterized membrane protein